MDYGGASWEDVRRIAELADEISKRRGEMVTRDMFNYVLQGPPPWRKAFDKKLSLVLRLLKMSGGPNKYKLAQVIAEENTQSGPANAKRAERQIDDAIAAVRQFQKETGSCFTFKVGEVQQGPAEYGTYGLTYFVFG
jgi:hypothetical protein